MSPRYEPVDPSPQVTPRPDGAVGDGLAIPVAIPFATPAPPPAAHRRQDRVQMNTKIRVEVRRSLDEFVAAHSSTVQGVLEAALIEYMAARGWPPEREDPDVR